MAFVSKFSFLTRSVTNAAASQKVKPSEQVFGLESRYAAALYSVASKLKQLDKVEKDLTTLQATIKSNTKFHEYVTNPIIIKRVMCNALENASGKFNLAPITANLLGLLANNDHLTILDTIINTFKAIMVAHRNMVVCKIVTAKPLDSSQTKQLESALHPLLKNNQALKITSHVDPSIIGGLVVSIGDEYFDMSIANQVKLYRNVIESAALRQSARSFD